MSPGFVAFPPGIFSAAPKIPIIVRLMFKFDNISIKAKTVIPPLLSYLIHAIPLLGLRLIPPVSNVTVFPIITMGLSLIIPCFSRNISLGSLILPLDTDNIPSHFFCCSCFLFNTLTFRLPFFDS